MSKGYPCCFQTTPTFYCSALKRMNGSWHAEMEKLKKFGSTDIFRHASYHMLKNAYK
jgi:hypothetical protein